MSEMSTEEWREFCFKHTCSECGNGIYTNLSVKERKCFRCRDKPRKTDSRKGQ